MLILISLSANIPMDEISSLVLEHKYNDAVELSKTHVKKIGNETFKLILELNELADIAPVEIVERREKEIVDKLKNKDN